MSDVGIDFQVATFRRTFQRLCGGTEKDEKEQRRERLLRVGAAKAGTEATATYHQILRKAGYEIRRRLSPVTAIGKANLR